MEDKIEDKQKLISILSKFKNYIKNEPFQNKNNDTITSNDKNTEKLKDDPLQKLYYFYKTEKFFKKKKFEDISVLEMLEIIKRKKKLFK